MKTTFRSKVFKRAYEIMKNTNKTFCVCLAKSWQLYRLSKKLLSSEEVCFSYEKKDGSLRKAFGTLRNVTQFIKGTGTTTSKVFRYFDLEASAFRCFKVENLISIY